jgi:hypothetical protein
MREFFGKPDQNKLLSWEVAQTDQAPINTKFVSIFLSTDGGKTFEKPLLTSTPTMEKR